MTRQEALHELHTIFGYGFYNERVDEALDMAIEALEQESVKFYYVESIDDYWIGQRHDNFYYAKWNSKLGFVWSVSRYLPWGEHIVAEHTLWKEYTYPSKPKEIPFVEWIIGFVKKHFQQEPKRGHWTDTAGKPDDSQYSLYCSECDEWSEYRSRYCPNCGALMAGVREEDIE